VGDGGRVAVPTLLTCDTWTVTVLGTVDNSHMAPSTIQMLLELDPGAEPIAGVLRQPSCGDAKPFTGWPLLTEMLEAIRRSGTARDPEHRL
jgi:hypothetical protein